MIQVKELHDRVLPFSWVSAPRVTLTPRRGTGFGDVRHDKLIFISFSGVGELGLTVIAVWCVGSEPVAVEF